MRPTSSMLKTSVSVVLILPIVCAMADEVPTRGILYNTKEVSSLTFKCRQTNADSLECDFAQASVRRKSKPEALPEKLKQAKAEFAKGSAMSLEECKGARDLLDVLEGKKKAPKEDALASMTAVEKKDMIQYAQLAVKFCRSDSEADFLAIVRASHDRETRTCLVSSHNFSQVFQKSSPSSKGPAEWTTSTTPQGECGVVQLSRFEPEPAGGVNFTFWKYVARKAIINPNAKDSLGLQCRGLDENTYVYDWRKKEHQVGCAYVTFSAF